ncbi:hypothetical protein GWK47_010244 [Chionoecetes opilio]|uniref:Uncharacterized protein n=1 Tax=Chionoecetes opilio TaxID=41210 RepID=A0A8J5C3E8_CHIOP|nr:hypothetical protein GWK47_010244 [Chionoecetes opilio]
MTPTPVCATWARRVHFKAPDVPGTQVRRHVIGTRHLKNASHPPQHPYSLYRPLLPDSGWAVVTPALGCFYATLRLHGKILYRQDTGARGYSNAPPVLGHCMELAIHFNCLPEATMEVKHVNRCAEMTLPPTTSPSGARAHFLREFSEFYSPKRI